MSFETTPRTIAVAPDMVQPLFAILLEQFGEDLPDGQRMVRTIGGHWDDAAHTRVRAASLDIGSIVGLPLADGRLAFTALWQSDLASHFDAEGMPGIEQLSDVQLAALTVKEEL